MRLVAGLQFFFGVFRAIPSEKEKSYFEIKNNSLSLLRQIRAISSAGSEHLPYKQGVASSNLASPTPKSLQNQFLQGFFHFGPQAKKKLLFSRFVPDSLWKSLW
jgi:hypothetical protein